MRPLLVRALCLWLGLVLSLGFPSPASAEDKAIKGEAKARLERVETLLEEWNVSAARSELESLKQLVPASLEPILYFDGRVAFEEGRYDEAVKLLEQSGVGEGAGSYLKLAKDTQRITREHKRAESEHFVFFYPPGKDEVLAPYALETLEAIRAAMEADLGYAPPEKVRVEVVRDAAELAKVSTLTKEQIKTTGTIAICKFNKLMVTSPKAVVRGYDWQDTLAHEYVHLVVSRHSKNTVPIWLHEGMAKFLESRWRGKPGQALTPSTLALLGMRVKKDKLIPFEKMHPSIALLPSAEDAATAFAEVFFAIDLIHREKTAGGLRTIIGELAAGKDAKRAVEVAMGKSFPAFERAWLAHVRRQPFPKELIPMSSEERKEVKEPGKQAEAGKKPREISFGDFAEVGEEGARRYAHLGEVLRERKRLKAAAEEYGKAHRLVGDKYESISNKYSLALLELGRFAEAEKVLKGSLSVHPGSAATNVHLGRIHLRQKNWPAAKEAYLSALAADPFDEEIHVALVRIHEAMGAPALMERARKAAELLTGYEGEVVVRLARALARESDNLADMAIPPKEAPNEVSGSAASPRPAPDAGRAPSTPAAPATR